jgi:hypothetical protein
MGIDELAWAICNTLLRSAAVEVEGLGVFFRDQSGKISLRPNHRPRIFIAYVMEDLPAADKLFRCLEARGYAPWMDRRKLMPGQNWPRRLQHVIESTDFFIACFSVNSVRKPGAFQTEIRHGLECANRMPLDDVFMIPARLDDCHVPDRIRRETQYVDLFPDWSAGFERILTIIENQRYRL